jgi:hypothetical protein
MCAFDLLLRAEDARAAWAPLDEADTSVRVLWRL